VARQRVGVRSAYAQRAVAAGGQAGVWRVQLGATESSDVRRGAWAAVLIALAQADQALLLSVPDADRILDVLLLWPLSGAEAWLVRVPAMTTRPAGADAGQVPALSMLRPVGTIAARRAALVLPLAAMTDPPRTLTLPTHPHVLTHVHTMQACLCAHTHTHIPIRSHRHIHARKQTHVHTHIYTHEVGTPNDLT
jgi:hypothetical protein